MSHCLVPTLIGIHDAIQVSRISKVSFQRKHRMFVHYFGSLFVLKKYWKNHHIHTKDFLRQYLMLLHLLLCAAEVKGGISSQIYPLPLEKSTTTVLTKKLYCQY